MNALARSETDTDIPFRPRFPWLGADLQTIRNYLVRGNRDLSQWPGERLFFDAADATGDRFQAVLHRQGDAPLVVLVHGLTGCEGSFYVLESSANLLSAGYSVLRLNLRGAGPSRKTCGGHYCAGSSDDLATALRALPDGSTDNGLVLTGYSLGGNIVLKYLAEGAVDFRPACAFVVSPPVDLASAAERMLHFRNRLYHHWLLNRMKEEAVIDGARLTRDERARIESARTVVEFDDSFVAPHNGFRDAADYYARCSTIHRLSEVSVPTLLVHARNDPWIPAGSLRVGDAGAVHIVLTGSGGHVGFHGRGSPVPWHDRLMRRFFHSHLAPIATKGVTCP